jgi:hypothetical protein
LTITGDQGLEKASPVVRIPSLGEADWKIKVAGRGIHGLTLETASEKVTLPVYGTDRLVPIYRTFKKSSFWETLLNPGAPRIPDNMPVESVEINYPELSFNWGFVKLSWLWSFLIISMAFGVILKLVFGVE